ncbi:hypothetical protein ABZP36_002913 [Zizania latifolia]
MSRDLFRSAARSLSPSAGIRATGRLNTDLIKRQKEEEEGKEWEVVRMIRDGLKKLERRSQASEIFGGIRSPGELVEKFKSSLVKSETIVDKKERLKNKALMISRYSGACFKLKQAGQSTGDNIVDVTGKVGSVAKNRWSVFQEARQRRLPPGETVQERFISAAATTRVLLREGISEMKEKVAVGKVKVEEAAKKTVDKSKTILNNIERWQKGVASTDDHIAQLLTLWLIVI